MNGEELAENYGDLIKQRTLYYHRQYNGVVAFDDLYQQAWILALEALKRYDESRSRLSTYLWYALCPLRRYCNQEARRGQEESLPAGYTTPVAPLSLAERNGLSAVGTRVLQDVLGRIGHPGRHPTAESVSQRLRAEGWAKPEVLRGWEELRKKWEEEQ